MALTKNMKEKIAIIGLGYVGLPLAVEFSKYFSVIGYDKNNQRINELNNFKDSTGEISRNKLKYYLTSNKLSLVSNDEIDLIQTANTYIVTVPTPIDKENKPDLRPLISASETVGKYINKNDTIIFESTVYPGTTEEICVPIIEKISNLKFNKDFYVGYSPERINPGDKKRTIDKIIKVTSGSTPEIAKKIDALYKKIITAGTYLAPSIRIAEAAKVIENAQRDINIAFVNELSQIFNLLNLDTLEILKAASTKWNFLDFKPGLVGGHCIGVDPYYLAYKSELLGYKPKIILSGREVNDSMSKFIFKEIIRLLKLREIEVDNSRTLILGFTFKENCNDFRNTKVLDIYNLFKNRNLKVEIYDPVVDKIAVKKEYNIDIIKSLPSKKYDAILLAVSHDNFKSININDLLKPKSVIYDAKGFLNVKVDGRL